MQLLDYANVRVRLFNEIILFTIVCHLHACRVLLWSLTLSILLSVYPSYLTWWVPVILSRFTVTIYQRFECCLDRVAISHDAVAVIWPSFWYHVFSLLLFLLMTFIVHTYCVRRLGLFFFPRVVFRVCVSFFTCSFCFSLDLLTLFSYPV